VELEPAVPANTSCAPPPLPRPEELDCVGAPGGALSGRLDTPRKVAHMVQFGFDVGTFLKFVQKYARSL